MKKASLESVSYFISMSCLCFKMFVPSAACFKHVNAFLLLVIPLAGSRPLLRPADFAGHAVRCSELHFSLCLHTNCDVFSVSTCRCPWRWAFLQSSMVAPSFAATLLALEWPWMERKATYDISLCVVLWGLCIEPRASYSDSGYHNIAISFMEVWVRSPILLKVFIVAFHCHLKSEWALPDNTRNMGALQSCSVLWPTQHTLYLCVYMYVTIARSHLLTLRSRHLFTVWDC